MSAPSMAMHPTLPPPTHLRHSTLPTSQTNFGIKYGSCSAMASVRWRPDNPRPKAPEALGWRLLTGHSGGQCLVWDLSNGRATAVCTLGVGGSPAIR